MLTVDTFPTLAEAANAMGERSRFLAGGTLVMRDVNYGDQGFDRIVRATDASLGQIRTDGPRIIIGAGVTMTEVARSADLAFLAPVARAIGGPAVRNMATVGGNLFAPAPYGDFTTALLALDGIVRMADGAEQALDAFLANRDTARGLVAAISIARPQGDDFRFRKISRIKPKGVSVMSIAAWLPRPGGRVQNARVAFGAMGPTPLRAVGAERALEGATLDAASIAPALAAVMQGLAPADDPLASAWYRAEVAPVHLRRLLLGEVAR